MHAADLFFYGAVSFLLGVGLAGFGIGFYWIILAGLLFLIFLFFKKKAIYGILFFFLIFSGFFYYNFRQNIKAASENIPLNKEISFEGIISGEPVPQEKFQLLDVRLQKPLAGEITVLADKNSVYHYGELLNIGGKIEAPRNKAENPAVFFQKIKILAEHRGFWLTEKLLDFKETIISSFRGFLPPDSAALLSGLTLGWQGDFTKNFKNQMSLSGTTHLVALSGYNISILVISLAAVLGSFLPRRWTFYLTSLIIFLFVLMVGGGASVIRAAAMGFLVLLAQELGRVYSVRNAVALAALLMVAVEPKVLNFNIGFQLSFLSLLGIVYLSPVLKKILKIKDDGGMLGWKENAVITLSAQLAVAPVLIRDFGQFSLTSLLANILILEFVPLTMFFGFLLAVFGFIFRYLGFFIAWLVNILLVYELEIIKIFSVWKLNVPTFLGSVLFVLVYYLGLGFLIYQYSRRGSILSLTND